MILLKSFRGQWVKCYVGYVCWQSSTRSFFDFQMNSGEHYCQVTWPSWHLKSLATLAFVQQLAELNNKGNIQAPQSRLHFLSQRACYIEAFTCHYDIMANSTCWCLWKWLSFCRQYFKVPFSVRENVFWLSFIKLSNKFHPTWTNY